LQSSQDLLTAPFGSLGCDERIDWCQVYAKLRQYVSITQPPCDRALIRGHDRDGVGSDLPFPRHLRRQRIDTGERPTTGLFSDATYRAPGWTFNNCYERDHWAARPEIYVNGRGERELRGKRLHGLHPRAFQPVCSPVFRDSQNPVHWESSARKLLFEYDSGRLHPRS
jgi:hypothetical protein